MSTNHPHDPGRPGGRTAGHGGHGAQWALADLSLAECSLAPSTSASSSLVLPPLTRGHGGPERGGGQDLCGPGLPLSGGQPGRPVGPVGAVRRLYTQYVQFSGRASRSEYWWAQLCCGVAWLVPTVLAGAFHDAAAHGVGIVSALLALLALGFLLVSVVPMAALTVRRLHDANRSGWCCLLGLVPFGGCVAVLALAAMPSRREGARFDR